MSRYFGGFDAQPQYSVIKHIKHTLYLDKIYYDNIEAIGSFNDMMKYDIININTADVLRLTELKGIGEKTAQKIIDYRTQNGSFESIEDIMNVEGIGDKTFEEIKDYITVEGVE